MLRALHLEQRKRALAAGDALPSRLFPGTDPDSFRRREWQAHAAAGWHLRHVPIKALRHTFASLLIAQGEPPAYVRDQLGHHSARSPWTTTGTSYQVATAPQSIASTTTLAARPAATPAQPASGDEL